MTSYLHRLGFTAWRKKSTFLLTIGLLALILVGLQYSQLGNRSKSDYSQDTSTKEFKNRYVNFITSLFQYGVTNTIKKVTDINFDKNIGNMDQPSREEIAARRQGMKQSFETGHDLGIPHSVIDSVSPYIPKKRLVHLDLKGAPPLIPYLKKFLSLVRTLGATGILLEYEDMFPFSGILKDIRAKNAYTVQQVAEILELAASFNLEVIPLVQTFGHLEFALKHKKWEELREVKESPQALCPSRNSSLVFISELIDQVLSLHPSINYLHIGCDEVFQMGECSLCRLELHEMLFLRHVRNVANIVHSRRPDLLLIIWDDMLRHLSLEAMQEVKLGDLVEPMMWVYAEDIYRFIQQPTLQKYSSVFKSAWTASAFKGAFGETLYVPDAKRHLANNIRWLEFMAQEQKMFKRGFTGIALTGWQRYDHFAVLCELLPAAVPSLALNLLTVSNGYFNASLKERFLSSLSCPLNQRSSHSAPFISLDSDPNLWDKLGRCMFSGSIFFRLTYRLNSVETEVNEFLKQIKQDRGWMTAYNVKHNYSLPLRVEELTSDLPRLHHSVVQLARASYDAMVGIFDKYTIGEWIEQKVYPFVIELEKIQNESIALKSVNQWPSRPLPLSKNLQRLGINLT